MKINMDIEYSIKKKKKYLLQRQMNYLLFFNINITLSRET